VLTGIVCTAAWFITEPKYRSVSTLEIQEKREYIAFNPDDHSNEFAETQVELIKGPYIVGRAVDSESLAHLPELDELAGKEDAVAWVTKNLKASRTGRSALYEVSFTTKTPESAQKVTEAIVDTYMEFQSNDADARRKKMLEVLNEEVGLYDKKIERARIMIREMAKLAEAADAFPSGPEIGADGAVSTAARSALVQGLVQRLVDTEVDLELARARVAVATDEIDQPSNIPENQLAPALLRDPEILQSGREIRAKRAKLARLTADDPAAAKLREELAAEEKLLDDRTQELRATLTAEAQEAIVRERRDALKQAAADLQLKQRTAALLKARIESERASEAHYGDRSLELNFARDELAKLEGIRRQLSDRIVLLQTESRAPSQVRMIHKATTPEFPEGPARWAVLAIAGPVAFLTPFVLSTACVLIASRWRGRQ
jgi:uncharacterized protein involved in exopolysaccharide biosynthesis